MDRQNLKKSYWLMKTEPSTFSMVDFMQAPGQTTFWDGVRNYQARNFLRDSILIGDKVIIYHSNAEPPGIAGFCEVIKSGAPDPTGLDPRSPYFDPKASPDSPIWFGVTLGKPKISPKFLSLDELRQETRLSGMLLLRKGQRLSVMPLTKNEYSIICEMAGLPIGS